MLLNDFSYILFGAIIFIRWEDSWKVLTGCYFCFISLSSIGFGDVVPGDKVNIKQIRNFSYFINTNDTFSFFA